VYNIEFVTSATAVESLAKVGADAIEPLAKALKNDDTETRINSAKSLAEIGDKRAIEPLKSTQAEEKDEDVKKAFEEAIKKLEK
jgi:HEAT repeat protein